MALIIISFGTEQKRNTMTSLLQYPPSYGIATTLKESVNFRKESEDYMNGAKKVRYRR
jgi:hypothetical protein